MQMLFSRLERVPQLEKHDATEAKKDTDETILDELKKIRALLEVLAGFNAGDFSNFKEG